MKIRKFCPVNANYERKKALEDFYCDYSRQRRLPLGVEESHLYSSHTGVPSPDLPSSNEHEHLPPSQGQTAAGIPDISLTQGLVAEKIYGSSSEF